MSNSPSRMRNNSSVSSCLCHTHAPCVFTSRTSLSLYLATILGAQCSLNCSSFSLSFTRVGLRRFILLPLRFAPDRARQRLPHQIQRECPRALRATHNRDPAPVHFRRTSPPALRTRIAISLENDFASHFGAQNLSDL